MLCLGFLVTTLVASAGGAGARAAGSASLALEGEISGRFTHASCVILPNPLATKLKRRYVEIVLTGHNATIQVTIDNWQSGTVRLGSTKTDSVGIGERTANGLVWSWSAGWTATQVPALSRTGRDLGSGTLTSSRNGGSGRLKVTLVPTKNVPRNRARAPLRVNGSWTGC